MFLDSRCNGNFHLGELFWLFISWTFILVINLLDIYFGYYLGELFLLCIFGTVNLVIIYDSCLGYLYPVQLFILKATKDILVIYI